MALLDPLRRLKYSYLKHYATVRDFFVLRPITKGIYIRNYLGLLSRNRTYIMKYRNGMQIAFRAGTHDLLIQRELLLAGDVYNRYDRHLNEAVTDLKRVVDLGAHIGVFALDVLYKNRHAEVICVEAENSNFELLRKNIELNGMSHRVKLVHKAIWDKTGQKLSLHISGTNTGGHSFVIEKSRKEEEIETISLDDLLGSSGCDLLKLDIEGSEYQVLKGSDLSKIRNIASETHFVDHAQNPDTLAAFLEGQHFRVVRNRKFLWAMR